MTVLPPSWRVGIFVKQTNCVRRFLAKCNSTSSANCKEVKTVLENVEELTMIPLKLTGCMFGKPFSSSHIKYDEFYTNVTPGQEMVPEVTFKTLFQRGFEQLYRLTDGDTSLSMNKETMSFISALQPLQSFLEDIEFHESALKRKDEEIDILRDFNESAVAALLTHHLLSPLVPGNEYIISSDYSDKQTHCPCWNNCTKKINYGRTSIGSLKMWYGVPDVVLLPNSIMVESVTKKKKKRNYKLLDEEKISEMCEVKRHGGELDSEQITSQIISQAVIFSLYISNLRVRKPEMKIPDISLIPSVIINPCSLHVYMYDYKNDVLLRSDGPPLQLWDESGYKFKRSTIFYIWMILNHMICMPQLHSMQLECLQNSSNFHNLCAAHGLQPSEISGEILFRNSFRPHRDLKKKRQRFRLEP